MGFGTGCTAGAEIDGVLLTERERWHGLGNDIHAAVLDHVMVSVLLSRGVIHRGHEQLAQQAWTRLWDLTHQEYAGEHSLEGDHWANARAARAGGSTAAAQGHHRQTEQQGAKAWEASSIQS